MKKKLLGLLFVTLFFALHLGLMLFSKFMSIAFRSKEVVLFITLFVRYLVLIYLCYKSYLIFCSWFHPPKVHRRFCVCTTQWLTSSSIVDQFVSRSTL